MRHLMKRIKTKAILPAAAFLAAAAIGTTFAWQTWDLSVTNELRSHTTAVKVDEEGFNPSTGVKPVKFINTGNSSVFLRVSYTEYWEKEKDRDTYLISNVAPDGITEMAVKNWTEYWPDSTKETKNAEWTYGGDGWYYYNKILKAGGSTERILDSVTFENITEDNKEYLDANYRLYFKAEVVQCSDGSNTLNSEEVNNDATQKMFGRSPSVDLVNGTVSW